MGTYKTSEEEFKLLHKKFVLKTSKTKNEFIRYLEPKVDWQNRFIAILGARGCGKTTFLYQYIKNNLKLDNSVIYANLDDLYFTSHRLVDFADDFVTNGGEYLFLDEVHKYPNWSIELKNIYDTYDDLRIIFTSSSILEVYKGNADLSRRLVTYQMEGLSFREFLYFERGIKTNVRSLEEITQNHIDISKELTADVKIIPLFKEYLSFGYYPYYKESKNSYYSKLENTVNLTLETDLPAVKNIDYASVYKLKKLIYYLSMNGPYKPDITKLASQLEIGRATLLNFLDYLHGAKILNLLKTEKGNESVLTKPEKVYLHNTNLVYAFGMNTTDIGSIREIFFFNQLAATHKVEYTEVGDFLIDKKYTFEVGGKNKTTAQIKNVPNSFVAADGIEHGYMNTVPLWMFGLMY